MPISRHLALNSWQTTGERKEWAGGGTAGSTGARRASLGQSCGQQIKHFLARLRGQHFCRNANTGSALKAKNATAANSFMERMRIFLPGRKGRGRRALTRPKRKPPSWEPKEHSAKSSLARGQEGKVHHRHLRNSPPWRARKGASGAGTGTGSPWNSPEQT